MAFIVTGALGFLWLLFWLNLYSRPEEQKRLSSLELSYIRSDPPEPLGKIPWFPLLLFRQTWAFSLGKFMTDPIWWFYLFWLPKFLNSVHGVKTADMIPLPGNGLHRGRHRLNRRRLAVFSASQTRLVCQRSPQDNHALSALCVVPVSDSFADTQLVVGGRFGEPGGRSPSRLVRPISSPSVRILSRRAVASVVGIGGFFGALEEC
jgi:ACS family hexuronate transporter-like MFS transporter